MNAISTSKNVEYQLRLAKYLLFRYAPITQIILGYAEFEFSDVSTVASSVDNGHLKILINKKFAEEIEPQEMAVILYIEAVRIGLGHVTNRMYSNRKLSLEASDLIVLRLGLMSDIGVNNPAYSKILKKVTEMESTIRGIYFSEFYKDYDFRSVSIEILYRLLSNYESGKKDSDGNDSDESKSNSDGSPLSSYLNDTSRAGKWKSDSCITQEAHSAAISGDTAWGNAASSGAISMISASHEQINPRKMIKRFISKSIECGYEDTRMKRNRRFGLMYPGHRYEYTSNILIAGDVSNSMPASSVGKIAELIISTGKRISLDYCWWNTKCTLPKKLYKRDVSGKRFSTTTGGGTDCNCLFRMLEKCHSRYDAIVIVSDMQFNPDIHLAKKYRAGRILWVKTRSDKNPPEKYARHVIDLNDMMQTPHAL
jgi:predicted metal-dependent peptidase